MTVIDGTPVVQSFQAARVTPDGSRIDVTSKTTFVLADASYGSWSGSTLSITGATAGPTTVKAIMDGISGETTLTVNVVEHEVVDGAPGDIVNRFAAAAETSGSAPSIVASSGDHIVWVTPTESADWNVSIHGAYADLEVYSGNPLRRSIALTPQQIALLDHAADDVSPMVTIAALTTASAKTTSAPASVTTASEPVVVHASAMIGHQVEVGSLAPAPLIPDANGTVSSIAKFVSFVRPTPTTRIAS